MLEENNVNYPIVRASEFESADDYLKRFASQKAALIEIARLCMEIDIKQCERFELKLRGGEHKQLKRKVENLEQYLRDLKARPKREQVWQASTIEQGETWNGEAEELQGRGPLHKILDQQLKVIRILQQKDPNGFNGIEEEKESDNLYKLLNLIAKLRHEGDVDEAIMIADYILLVYYGGQCEKEMSPEEKEKAVAHIREIYARVYKQCHSSIIVKDNEEMIKPSTIWMLRRKHQNAQNSLEYTKKEIESKVTPPAVKANIITSACQVIREYCRSHATESNKLNIGYMQAITRVEESIIKYYETCQQNKFLIRAPWQQIREFRKAMYWLEQIVTLGMRIAGELEPQRTQEDEERNRRASITPQSSSDRYTQIARDIASLSQEIERDGKKNEDEAVQYLLEKAVEIDKRLKNPELFTQLRGAEEAKNFTYRINSSIKRDSQLLKATIYIFTGNEAEHDDERINGGTYKEELDLVITKDNYTKKCTTTIVYRVMKRSNQSITVSIEYDYVTGVVKEINWIDTSPMKGEAKFYKIIGKCIVEQSVGSQNPKSITANNRTDGRVPILVGDNIVMQVCEVTLKFPKQINPEKLEEVINEGENPFIEEIPFPQLYERKFPDLIGITQEREVKK